jgi:translocation and assembly module TamB
VIKRSLRVLLLGLAVLLLGIVAAVGWLLYTESGASWAWSRAQAALPGQLEAREMRGSVSGGLTFSAPRYSDPAVIVSAAELQLAINLDLLPLAITVVNLRAHDLAVQLQESAPGDEPEAAAPALRDIFSSLRLPLRVRVRDLRIADAAVHSGGQPVFVLDELELDASLHEELSVERLRYVTQPLQATLNGVMQLDAPFATKAAVIADVMLVDDAGTATPVALQLDVDGDLDHLGVALRAESHSLTITGSVANVDRAPDFDLVLAASDLQWPLQSAEPVVSVRFLESQLSGQVNDYQASFNTSLHTAASGDVDADGDLSGDLQGIEVRRLLLHSADADANVEGELGWAGPFTAGARIDLQRLDPQRWIAAWPVQQSLSGNVDAAISGSRLQVNTLQLRQANSTAAVDARGIVDLDNGVVDAGLSWSALQWPLAPGPAEVDSREASLTVSGTPDNWSLAGDIAVGAGEFPEGRFTLRGDGTRNGVDLVLNDSEVLGGRVTGRLSYSWIDENAYSAELETRDVRTTALLPDWPGRISSRFEVSGQVAPFAMDLRINDLQGELRARPVAARGQLQVTGERFVARQLELQSGQSSLRLDGNWADGLRFELDVPALGDLLPAAAGRVQASGRVAAGTDLPLLEMNLTGDELRWQDWLAEHIEVRNESPVADRPLALTVQVANVVQGERAIAGAELRLDGSLQQHELALQVDGADSRAALALRGSLPSLADPDATWRGELTSFSAQQATDVELSLREPAALELGRKLAQLGEACIVVATGGDVCLRGNWSEAGSYAAAFALNAMPLDLLRIATGSDLEFSQTLDGTIEVAAGREGRLSGNGRIDVSPGIIRNQFDERLTLRTRAGFASFELDNGQLLAGAISLPFSDAAEISGEFRVLDLAAGQQSAVEGRLLANIRDIGVGARIVPVVDDAKGQLDADVRINGTLAEPLFSGGLTLRDGRFGYNPLGLVIDELEIDSTILPGNRIELQTGFRAGEGRGKLSSSADYLQGRSAGLELALTGTNLTLINLDDLRVTIDPDVQLGLRNNDVSINGRVAVPEARLASVNLINNGETESDDVVFVGAEIPAEEVVAEAASPLNFSGSVELELGDQVIIDLDVAEARLRGRTRFTWAGPALPKASGGIEVSGKFEAYGQLLEISEGNIRFPNVAADNPELRIRAEREIFGNSQVRRAGVLVSGTAQRPQLEVYTTPATTQDRAITLLATGSDFNYEQGVGAVDVGTYIAPKLYASYGIGLFDKENVISVRYDLAAGFGLKATSGKRAAGVDISYTIER